MISSEVCTTQRKLSAWDLVVSVKPVKPIRIPRRRKTCKLKDTVVQKEFEQAVSVKCQQIPAKVESVWESIKNWLFEAADEICGWTWGGCPQHKKSWWWNNDVEKAVKKKQKVWKQWKNGGTKEEYVKAKKEIIRQNSLLALTITVKKIAF